MPSSPYRPSTLRSNLWKLFAYSFLSEFWLVAPVLFPYYQSRGLDTAEGMSVQAVYAAGVILFEVPSGYLADRFGRKRTLVAAGCLLVGGLLIYALAASFWFFALAELAVAAAN